MPSQLRHHENAGSDVLHHPVDAVHESVAGHGAASLDRPVSSAELLLSQLKHAGDLLRGKCARQILLVAENKQLQKDMDTLKVNLAKSSGSGLLSSVENINGVAVLSKIVHGEDAKSLRLLADQVRAQLVQGVFMLAGINGDRASLVAGVTKDLTNKIKAEELMRFFVEQVDGQGGGRADMAQGSATNIGALPEAIASVTTWVAGKVG